MKINLKSIFCILLVIIFITIMQLQVFAVTQQDIDDVNKKIEEKENEIEDVKSEKSDIMDDIAELTAEISKFEEDISKLEGEISKLENNIEKNEAEIEEKQEIYDENYKIFQERMIATYEMGSVSYLDVILSSKDLSQMLSSLYYLSEIATADKDFLESIERQQKELEAAKKTLENDKKEVEAKKQNLEKTNTSLKNSRNTKNNYVAQLSDEQKQLQAELDQFEKDKRELQRELTAISQSNDYGTITPNEAGYISPLKGRTTRDIYCGYYGYVGHTGVDFSYSGIMGETIYAVKSGTVVKSLAYMSGGRYYSYGECIVIDHHDGTMTLYAHGMPGSRKVSVGQTVQQGQAIMNVGTTGNSTGYHLHFEVRINGYPVDPTPYLP